MFDLLEATYPPSLSRSEEDELIDYEDAVSEVDLPAPAVGERLGSSKRKESISDGAFVYMATRSAC